MKTPLLLRFPAVFALVASACSVSAQSVITLNPSADTFLMWNSYDGVGEADTAQQTARTDFLYIVHSADDIYQSYPLLRFDLSAYAGYTITSDATLTFHYESLKAGTYGSNRTIEVRLLDTAFDPATTTFNNYEATNWSDGENLISTFSDAVGTGGSNGDPGSITFSLASGVLQNWIDSPENNFGIALVGISPTSDIYGYSMDSSFAPELSFTAVPEPSTYAALAGVAVLGLALWRRRGLRRAANP